MRVCREAWFQAQDGEALFYRHGAAESQPPRGAILLLHRGHEHSGRMVHLVDELELPDFECFAFDARGHGRSRGTAGESPCASTLVADIEHFVRHLRSAHGIEPERLVVVAQSLSAVLTAAWVHDYAPRIRALVLAAPAFRIKLYVPFARFLLSVALKLRGNFLVRSYVKARHLTQDPERIAAYDADPLITHTIPVALLLGLDRLARRVVADAKAITVPTQILVSGRDLVVDAKPQRVFYERLGARTKGCETFPGLFHDTLGELGRGPVVAALRAFLLARFAAPVELPSVGASEAFLYTQREADRLLAPLPALSFRGLYWRTARAMLSVAGRFSKGIEIGRRTGFDSGESLDYVYRNEATGRGIIGRAVDRVYLDAVGWRGIRRRKANIEAAIRDAARALRESGMPVQILDIAAGRGRYILDALDSEARPDAVELRDHSASNVFAGRALIAERGWADVASYRRADAFQAPAAGEGIASPKRFTLAIVSGLYELYTDNEPVRCSLAQIADELAPGALLIYTGQPWHPQLEFIARALTRERDGAPWVMRRRPQAELDALVEAAGFEKLGERIDDDGIFTVSLARQRSSLAVGASSRAQALKATA